MNIDDVDSGDIEVPSDDKIMRHLFGHQYNLAIKYGPIEERNGFYHPNLENAPHLDDAQFQTWIKNFFWRTTEELCEAMETIPDLTGDWKTRWQGDADLRHFFEEIADALHFLVEVSVALKVDPDALKEAWTRTEAFIEANPTLNSITAIGVRLLFGDVIYHMGLAANGLKNKPWKSTHMPTDERRFKQNLMMAWSKFIYAWCRLGCSLRYVYVLYMKKNLVNQFRQESNY